MIDFVSIGIIVLAWSFVGALIIGVARIIQMFLSHNEDFIENMNDPTAPFEDYLITIGMRALK